MLLFFFLFCSATPNSDIIVSMMKEDTLWKKKKPSATQAYLTLHHTLFGTQTACCCSSWPTTCHSKPAVNLRCRVWRAHILDVVHCDLLLKYLCDVCKIFQHKTANLLTSSLVFLSFTIRIPVPIICCLSHFELTRRKTVHLNNLRIT